MGFWEHAGAHARLLPPGNGVCAEYATHAHFDERCVLCGDGGVGMAMAVVEITLFGETYRGPYGLSQCSGLKAGGGRLGERVRRINLSDFIPEVAPYLSWAQREIGLRCGLFVFLLGALSRPSDGVGAVKLLLSLRSNPVS
ncbi:hypothetical protein PV325_007138 [Microctonus aethiopoides]|uniref:Uncharacterized protein n=1 Tax=Microctonus aethiopoides TaxID=144406 RepID=A0AA39FYN1_9HYME|nr:hypothetical protein PV325_007138 [Microctonus aethiopoides]KAK0177875.1 hypothetical protein PV328_001882 [Microctonus aethiopoides]